MPSPTSRTCPVSCVSSFFRYCSISFVRIELISPAFNLMAASLDQVVLEQYQLGANAAIVFVIADAHHEPTDQVGIDARLQNRLLGLPGQSLQFLYQAA